MFLMRLGEQITERGLGNGINGFLKSSGWSAAVVVCRLLRRRDEHFDCYRLC
jgi:hypothetical protein